MAYMGALITRLKTGWIGPKNGGEWSYIQLGVCDQWFSSRLNIGPSPVQYLYQ